MIHNEVYLFLLAKETNSDENLEYVVVKKNIYNI
jgi:hypothetical protein